jgi:hypothetical protein
MGDLTWDDPPTPEEIEAAKKAARKPLTWDDPPTAEEIAEARRPKPNKKPVFTDAELDALIAEPAKKEDLNALWEKATPIFTDAELDALIAEEPAKKEDLAALWEKATHISKEPSPIDRLRAAAPAIGRGVLEVLPRAKAAALGAQLGNELQREKDHPFTTEEVKRYAEAHPVPFSKAHPEANAGPWPVLRKTLGLERPETQVPMPLNQALEAMYSERGQPTSKQVYDLAKAEAEADTEAIRKAHPWAYLGGNAAGNLALAAVPGLGLSGKVEKGAGLLKTAKAAASAGGRMGALEAGSKADWNNPLEAAKQTVMSGALGYGLGGTLGAAGYGAGKLLKAALRGVVKPSEAAERLRAAGVRLTPGQMNPRGALAQLEENATSLPWAGPKLTHARNASRREWQDAVINEGLAPGASPIKRSGFEERTGDALSKVYKGFEAAYAPAKKFSVEPVVPRGDRAISLADAFDAAVNDQKVIATDDLRGAVRHFLETELSKIPRVEVDPVFAAGGASRSVEAVPAGRLLDMRSSIRGAIRDALKAGDMKTVRLLHNAEGAITSSLEAQLPADVAEALASADRQYAKHMVIQDAVARSLDNPEGFTPHQLGTALRSAMERGAYARGGGGSLRDLAAAGREIFDARSPMTGHRAMSEWPTKIASPLLSTEWGQKLLTGMTPTQMRAQALVNALRAKAPEAPFSWTQGVAPELEDYAQRLAYGQR